MHSHTNRDKASNNKHCGTIKSWRDCRLLCNIDV